MNESEKSDRKYLNRRRGPSIVVDGVAVHDGGRRKKSGLVLALGTFALAGAFVLASAFFSSCSGSAGIALTAGGGARFRLETRVPSALAAKIRATSGITAATPLFDGAMAAKAAAARPELSLISFTSPDPDSMRAVVEAANLRKLLDRPDLASSGAVILEKGPAWTELRVHLERGKVAALVGLVPGLDRDLLDSLSPPALDPDPLTKAEYRKSLLRPFGEAAVLALDAAILTLRLEAPGAILAASGGKTSGTSLTVDIPAFDLLTLEKPIDFSLRWKN